MITDLQDEIWSELPYIRKRILGRERVNDIIHIAIEQAPTELFAYVSKGGDQEEIVKKTWSMAVKRSYSAVYGAKDDVAFGPLFWIIVAPIVAYIITRILDHWFKDPKQVIAWQKGLCNA